jgi:predicted RNA binding protein YcfA (HicA-like mRNA interferase family)
MAKLKKILAKVLAGSKNIAFDDFVVLVEGFGFRLSRISGSHHIFIHPKAKELVNLQNVKGQVKSYQIIISPRRNAQFNREIPHV